MDLLNKLADQATGNHANKPNPQEQKASSGSSSFLDKLHGLAGGGPESEKKEDALDKGTSLSTRGADALALRDPQMACTNKALGAGIDWVQEHILKQGAQNNENAAEQAKDKFIADAIRDQYQKATGKPFPAKVKEEEKKPSGFGGLFGN